MRGCAFEWRHPCHMILCYIVCVCVCVCVCEREREISTVTGHPVWWNDIFYLHCDSESYFLQIWTFCHLYTCQNGKKSPVYFSPILSEMFPSFFHYLVLAGRLDALFFPRIYLLIPGNQAEWGITSFHFILAPFSSTVYLSPAVLGLYLNRGWMCSVTLQSVFTLLPYFLLLLQFLFTSVSQDWWSAIEISFRV